MVSIKVISGEGRFCPPIHSIDVAIGSTLADAGHKPATARTRWSDVSAAIGRQAKQGPLDLDVRSYPARWDCLARLTFAHAARTLRDAGLFVRVGDAQTLGQVMSRTEIGVTYQHLIRRWLNGLVAAGQLRVDGDTYVADTPLRDPALSALWLEAEQLLDDDQPLITYLRNCGDLVSDVLRGKVSPLETLFPGGSFDLAEDLYQRSSTMRYINGLAAAAVEALGRTARGRRCACSKSVQARAARRRRCCPLFPRIAPNTCSLTCRTCSSTGLGNASSVNISSYLILGSTWSETRRIRDLHPRVSTSSCPPTRFTPP